MRLTQTDRDLIREVERWGYMTAEDVKLYLGKAETTVKWRLKRLVQSEFIGREKCPFGVFIYTPKRDFRGLDVGAFDHDQRAKRLAFMLSRRLKCAYMTVHELRKEAVEAGEAFSGKVPDFCLLQGEKRIAVEVELTQKSLKRQKEIFAKYAEEVARRKYASVFYYCGSKAILERVLKLAAEAGASAVIRAAMMPQEV